MLAANGAQLGSDDGEVHVGYVLHGLELDDDLVCHEEVESMQPDLHTTVLHGNRELALELDTPRS